MEDSLSSFLLFIIYALICLMATTNSIASLHTGEISSSEANIQILPSTSTNLRSKRDTSTKQGKVDEFLKLNVIAFNSSLKLNLKSVSADSIFSPNFQYNLIDMDKVTEQLVVQDITPSLNELKQIQDGMYSDVATNTVLHVQYFDLTNNQSKRKDIMVGSDISLNGMIGGRRIKRETHESAHVIEYLDNKRKLSTMWDFNVESKQDLTPRSGAAGELFSNKNLTITAELSFVVDYGLGNSMSRTQLLEYIAIMTQSANDKYATTSDPSIICQFVSLHVFNSRKAQPFIEALTPTPPRGDYNASNLFMGFQLWANTSEVQNAIPGLRFGKFDIVVLLVGLPLHAGVPQVNPIQAFGGAFQARACQTSVVFEAWLPIKPLNYAVLFVTDLHGIFYGSFTLAHEIAHSLGASHDSAHVDDPTCNGTTLGHIMNDDVWGTLERFSLSPCSLREIKEYALSTKGSCLQIKNGPPIKHVTSQQEGDLVNLGVICQKMLSKNMTHPVPWYQGPDESCRQILCWDSGNYSTAGGEELRPMHPGNGIPCGHKNTGKCKNGHCIGDKPTNLDEICKEATGEPNSIFVRSKSVDPCAINFTCKVGKQTMVIKGSRPPSGTSCGNNGETCFEGKCMPKGGALPFRFTALDACRLIMKSDKAKVLLNLNNDGDLNDARNVLCSKLKCGDDEGRIREARTPTPDGTVCGPLRKCKNGKCVICGQTSKS